MVCQKVGSTNHKDPSQVLLVPCWENLVQAPIRQVFACCKSWAAEIRPKWHRPEVLRSPWTRVSHHLLYLCCFHTWFPSLILHCCPCMARPGLQCLWRQDGRLRRYCRRVKVPQSRAGLLLDHFCISACIEHSGTNPWQQKLATARRHKSQGLVNLSCYQRCPRYHCGARA